MKPDIRRPLSQITTDTYKDIEAILSLLYPTIRTIETRAIQLGAKAGDINQHPDWPQGLEQVKLAHITANLNRVLIRLDHIEYCD